jgi:hypothetical protein
LAATLQFPVFGFTHVCPKLMELNMGAATAAADRTAK